MRLKMMQDIESERKEFLKALNALENAERKAVVRQKEREMREIKIYQPYINSRYFWIKTNLRLYRQRKYDESRFAWCPYVADNYRKIWLKKLRSHFILRQILKS